MATGTNEWDQRQAEHQSVLIRRPGAFAAVSIPLACLSFLWIQAPVDYLLWCVASGTILGALLFAAMLPKYSGCNPLAHILAVSVFTLANTVRFSGQKGQLLCSFQGLLFVIASAAVLMLLLFRIVRRKRIAAGSPTRD